MKKMYAHLLVISQSRDINLFQLFKHELSLVPSALFNKYDDMRKRNKPIQVEKLALLPTTPLNPVDLEL